MWSDAFLAERRGGVFNYDKIGNSKDNDDKDDNDVNNDNKVDVRLGRSIALGICQWGGEAKRGTMPSWQGGKLTTTRMMMTCHVNKDVDNDVGGQRRGKQQRIQQ